VQSFNDTELKALGRTHSADEALSAFNMVREAGFTSIGIDLIYAIPGQSVSDFKENLEQAVTLRPEHISIYGLTLEDGTPMKEAVERGEVELVPEDDEAKCYVLAGEILNEAGYTRYEISNFALPGRESKHNLRYWESSDYLGLGAGAHSCSVVLVDGDTQTKRWWNIKDVDRYMREVEEHGQALAGEETLSADEERLEALYLGLRLLKGIDIAVFKEKFKVSPIELLGIKAVNEGLVKVDDSGGQGERLRLTSKGLLFSNELF
jgi:oxygen-independent coproporphyrinogen-3 oxidase